MLSLALIMFIAVPWMEVLKVVKAAEYICRIY